MTRCSQCRKPQPMPPPGACNADPCEDCLRSGHETPLLALTEQTWDYKVLRDEVVQRRGGSRCDRCRSTAPYRSVMFETSKVLGAEVTCTGCGFTGASHVDKQAARTLREMWGEGVRPYIAHVVYDCIREQFRGESTT